MAEGDDILVLGATSLIGRFLLPRLAAEGLTVTALSRVARSETDGVRWVLGDLATPETLAAIGPVALVFSLSPIWLLSRDALAALRGLGMKRLVAFSSTSVSTKATSFTASERQVAAALKLGEKLVTRFCGAHEVDFTILRPTLIYAEGQDGNVSRLAGLIRRFGVFPLPDGGRGLRQPVHADDLAAVALAAMERGSKNRAYNVPGGETLTYRAMVERIFQGLGRRPLILSVPLLAMRLIYYVSGVHGRGATASMIDRMAENLVFDPADAQRDLGWAPRDFHPRF